MSDDVKILKLPYSENYIQNRIDNFYMEFLSHEIDPDDIGKILATIHDYLILCDSGESHELSNTLINLRQSIFWLHTWNSNEFES